MSDSDQRERNHSIPATRRDVDRVLVFLCLVLAQTASGLPVAVLWLLFAVYFLFGQHWGNDGD
jgi:hypothetical protein